MKEKIGNVENMAPEMLRGKKYGDQSFEYGLCPIAEEYQKKIMAFKSNYRNLDEAKIQSDILSELIKKIS